ncbi:MAG TPA: hypothetical protein VFM80_04580 [Gracilimonas sp.]|uniref:hypothetical protein n=1 Tax=Gracilimonas sp. TaxID=1974203 RepID=UPI002DB4DD08|nr:hypothetical protein [Gracilimonas sp.]
MSKKKSLGHNPLAYSTRRHASFDFINPTGSDEDEEFDKDASNDEHDEHKVTKITASYYLEEPLVKRVKSLADQKDVSYSALVNDILKDSLKNITSKSDASAE